MLSFIKVLIKENKQDFNGERCIGKGNNMNRKDTKDHIFFVVIVTK